MSRSYLVIRQKPNLIFNRDPDRKLFEPNKQGSIGIQQARSLIQWAYLKPFKKKFKVAIIQPADSLTTEAQNCLLKILEEPPLNTSIFLFAKRKESLLPTVISRCQIVRWENICDYDVADLLSVQTTQTSTNVGPIAAREMSSLIPGLSELPLSEAFSQINDLTKLKNRTEIVSLLQQAAILLHEKTIKQKHLQYLKRAGQIELCKKAILQQANTRLALENLYLTLKQ